MSNPSILEQNVRALAAVDPALAERLRGPHDRSHLLTAPDGSLLYRRGALVPPFALAVPELKLERPAQPDPRTVLLFGLGQGAVLGQALTVFPERRMVGWERDPALLSEVLARVPLEGPLREGRLRLLLGVDLLEVLPLPSDWVVALHPFLGQIYEEELTLLTKPLGPRRAVVCEGMLFVSELKSELRRRGFGVYPMHAARLPESERRRVLQKVKPELVGAINYTEGLPELCAQAGTKLLCWEVDPAVHPEFKQQIEVEQSYLFTYRKAYVDELRALGFRHVAHLPLAADPEVRSPVALTPEQRQRYGARVSFIGTSMVQDASAWRTLFLRAFAVRRGSAAEAAATLDRILAAQRTDLSTYRIRALVEKECQGFPEIETWRLVRCASEVVAAERRVTYVSSLSRFGIQVWGDPGWQVAQASGVTFRGGAGSYTDLNAIYCASEINVDIGRLHQLDIVTMRVFDILACGGFVLAEHSSDLEDLFEVGREIDSYRTLEELEAKVAHYLAHPEERQAIAAAGRAAVLERHTIARRVDQMLAAMGIDAHRMPSSRA